jgi:predicted amidohydrolase YtcJ
VSAIGGWHSSQLAEGRPPSREELDAAAPDNPVYLQELYDRGILNTAGLRAAGFPEDTGDLSGIREFAVPTALALAGTGNAEEGVRRMNAAFAAYGLTGVADGGGLMVTPRDYDPLYAVWRRGELDVRTRLYISAWTRGGEVDDIDRLTSLVQPGSGDGMLQVTGVGEIPHLGCHDMEGFDAFEIADAPHRELVEIVRLCVRRGWRMSIHAVLDRTLGRILDAWEQVEEETGGVRGAGFSIVHADEASRGNLERLARLQAGVLVQSRLLLKGGDYVDAWGEEATVSAPPLGDLRELGIIVGAGTDATRANWYSPWASIWWLTTGGTLSGRGVRDERHRLSRADALAAYTRDAAWFTGEQAHRGKLLPGYDGDVCVPTLDPFTCTDDDLRDIRSDLTVLGGRITHDTGVLDVEHAAEGERA